MHQQPVGPFHGDEVLGQRVGEHVAVRHDVHDVGAAVLLSKRHIGGADVEQENVFALGPVGHLEQRVGRGIDDDVVMVAVEEFLQRLDRLVGRGHGADVEAVVVAGEAAAGIVLLDGHLGPGDPGVLGLDIEPRGGPGMLDHLAEITDLERSQSR